MGWVVDGDGGGGGASDAGGGGRDRNGGRKEGRKEDRPATLGRGGARVGVGNNVREGWLEVEER
ncbi:hypothetical protein V1477_001239 [Vespula maculifrons]|uniref:Uncharacterized protein n=1 Tax=Vespula maculifrons TaxID=7453 RepID=A0ABD2D0J9_VESMC